mgnify:FL=1
MQKSKVALVKCESYDEKKVCLAVARAIELLGGIQKFTKHEDSVLLKPNLLSPQTPDKAVTTHPAVFYAVGKYFQDSDPSLKLSYGDSAPKGTTDKILSVTGIKDAAGKLNIPDRKSVV